MKDSLYLAYRYLSYHTGRTLVLTFSIAIIIYLPLGLKRLISESEERMLSRAESTPLIVGKKGSPTDLVINSLYFQQEKIETLTMNATSSLDNTGFGYSIPLLNTFNARGFPIVGTLNVRASSTLTLSILLPLESRASTNFILISCLSLQYYIPFLF